MSDKYPSGKPESFGWLKTNIVTKVSGRQQWELPDGSFHYLPPYPDIVITLVKGKFFWSRKSDSGSRGKAETA